MPKKSTKKKKLAAYYDDPALKSKFLRDMREHMKADNLTQGTYGYHTNGQYRGCSVGCTVYTAEKRLLRSKLKTPGGELDSLELYSLCRKLADSAHKLMAKHLGIPENLARLNDFVFENLPDDEAREWPLQFLKAMPVGADLSKVTKQLRQWLRTQRYLLITLEDLEDALANPGTHNGDSTSARAIRDKLLGLIKETKPVKVAESV